MESTFSILGSVLSIPYRSDNQKIWLLRTESGLYFTDFKTNGFVALGWDKIDRSIIEKSELSDPDKKEYIHSRYPNEKRPGLILSQLQCFYSQMKSNDLIVIPSKNSHSLAIGTIGDVVDSITHRIIDQDYFKCEYTHKRKVIWTDVIISSNDIYLSRVLKSHQTISDISDYSNILYRNILPLYVDDSSVHLTLKKNSETDLKLKDNILLQNSILNVIKTISLIYNHNSIEDSITIKTAVGSPGFIEIITTAISSVPAILFMISKLFGAVTDKNGNKVNGLSAIVSQINNLLNDKVDRELKKVDIEEKKKSLPLIDNEIQMKELEIKAKEISIKSDEQQLALNEMEIALKKAALASMEEDVRAKRIASYKELLSLKKETMEPFNSIEEKVNGEMESLLEIVKENDITIPA